MSPFTFFPSTPSASRSLLLTAALGMMPFLALPAQQPEEAKLLEVIKMTPQSPGKLKTGEKLTLEIRCTNPQKDPVLVFASAFTQGRVTRMSTTSGAYPSAPGESTVSRWISFKAAAEVDEIRISMVDAADQKKSIATMKVPVQLAWEGETIVATKPAPVPQKALRLTLVGYEVSQDAASAFFRLPPAEFAPEKVLATLAPMTAKGAARVVKLPVLDLPAGVTRGIAPPVGDYKLEADLECGRGGYVQAVYAIRVGNQSSVLNWMLIRLGQPVFMGSIPGTSSDKLILAFARVTES